MSLLDFLQTPEAQLGIGLLAYSGDMGRPMGFGERLAGAIGTTQKQQQAAEEKKLRAGLLEAQVGELQSKAAQRDRVQGLLGNVFGTPTTTMGAGSNVGPAAPSSPASGAGQGGGTEQAGARSLRGVPLEQIAALKAAGGPDLIEAWKLANVPTSMAAGSYAMLPGQAPQYMADPSKGLGIGPQGVYMLPGADTAQAALAGAQEAAVQRARAGYDLVNIKGPQGETIAVPRSQVLGSAAPSGAPAGFATEGQMRTGMTQPMTGTAGQYDLDIADIRKALASPSLDAGSRQLLQQELANRTEQRGRYFGGAPAAPAPAMAGNVVELSPLQQAQNEAQREQIVGQAKADVVPTDQKMSAFTSAQDAIGLIDRALAHPGRAVATGLSGTLDPRNYVPGTQARDFSVMLDQIKGGTFLQAFQSLKGGGAITEVEGRKAEQAIARLERAQSDGEFEAALKDYRVVLNRGMERARERAGIPADGPTPQPMPPKPTTFDDMPPAAKYKGRRIRGDDGRILQSDGMSWKEVR